MRPWMLPLLLPIAQACVIYDTDGDWCDDDDDDRDEDRDAPRDRDDDVRIAPVLSLVVAEGAPGEVLISGLVADQPVDWATVTAVRFARDVEAHDLRVVDDGLWFALRVDERAEPGVVSVEVATGDRVRPVADTFEILPAGESGEGEDPLVCGPVDPDVDDTGCP